MIRSRFSAYCLLLTAHCLLAAGTAAAAPALLRWQTDVARPQPRDWEVFQGETVVLAPVMTEGGEGVDLSGSACALWYQTNGMADAWWTISASTGLVAGEVRATWAPTNDCGAARYNYFIAAASPAGTMYRAFGRLVMRHAPGAVPNELPLPARVIDFAAVSVTNAPWATPGDLLSLSNILAGAGGVTNGAWATPGDLLSLSNALVEAGAGAIDPAEIAAWASTGTVARARMLADGNAESWIEYDGTGHWLVAVTLTSNIVVTATGGDGYQGPALGSVFGPPEFQPENLFLPNVWRYYDDDNIIEMIGPADLYAPGSWSATFNFIIWVPAAVPDTLPIRFSRGGTDQYFDLDWLRVTNRMPVTATPDVDVDADIAAATNALVQTYLLGTNAWMTISNQTLTISRVIDGVETSLWSSAESGGVGDTVDLAFTNALWTAIGGKADKAWGGYAPDGSANPDPAYMVMLNTPVVMHASGYAWATYGAYSVMAESGAVAYESGADGTARWGLDLHTNYVGFVRGGTVIVAAAAGAITVADGGTSNGLAKIVYPYTAGDFPALWHAPALDVPFTLQEGVAWVDNQDGTATVTAPATTPKGFWYATTTSTYDVVFDIRPPARLTGGVIGATNDTAVVYDSTITISSGGKTYRIPAQEVP